MSCRDATIIGIGKTRGGFASLRRHLEEWSYRTLVPLHCVLWCLLSALSTHAPTRAVASQTYMNMSAVVVLVRSRSEMTRAYCVYAAAVKPASLVLASAS